MLEILRIKNFILITEQEIEFHSGLTVVTGETGAGKSILLQALQLILGGRAKSGMIRKGAKEWEIEASISLRELSETALAELPEIAQNNERQLILHRSYGGNGKSRVLVNGNLASVSILEKIAQQLIHICAQGAFFSLLDPRKHLQILDEFAANEDAKAAYLDAFMTWQGLSKRFEEQKEKVENAALRRAELEYVIAELSEANIRPGVRAELEAEVRSLVSAQDRISLAQESQNAIEEDNGLLDQAFLVRQRLQRLQELDTGVEDDVTTLQSVIAELEELARNMARYVDSVPIDSEQLEQKQNELAEVARLERKFHKSDSELAALLEYHQNELRSLPTSEIIAQLEEDVLAAYEKVLVKADHLRKRREKAATVLSRSISKELKELSMPDARVTLEFTYGEPKEYGSEKVEFLVVTNAEADPQALKKVASGGELSRILLVLKKVLRDRSGVSVLVFDEVDSGVSGKVARAMGEKLKSLSENSQVLCITHLAQVASLADAHLVVSKTTGKGAKTYIESLSPENRVEEIARMLAGYKVTDVSRASARELLAS